MSWWKRKKCASCRDILKPKKGIHELRLNTADGVVELEVCGECARFWDTSADVLGKGRKKDDSDEQSI